MKHNSLEMLPSSDSEFLQNDPLAKYIKKIQSFRDLEEDEDLMPVAQREIVSAVNVVKAIYEKARRIPYFVAPTRSGGVGIEYQIEGIEAYYHVDIDGSIQFSAIKGEKLLSKKKFINPSEAPILLELF